MKQPYDFKIAEAISLLRSADQSIAGAYKDIQRHYRAITGDELRGEKGNQIWRKAIIISHVQKDLDSLIVRLNNAKDIDV